MSEFKILGSRILVTVPAAPESTIELTDEVKAQLHVEFVQKLKSLEVFAIGTDVTAVSVGEKVFVPSNIVMHADKVIIGDSVKLMVAERDIAIIWKEN
jgi:hypothetical protein